ncbi:MAG: hypothetical protein HC889_11310 [Synechococcaceae cyanobacterium SM1_2_3]|nr:hypothetical protein [Synechococcaceae cyanobacterium SM1_2_3]
MLATTMGGAVSNAYAVAKAGGKHAGYLNQYKPLPAHLVEKCRPHRGWSQSPSPATLPGWRHPAGTDPCHQGALTLQNQWICAAHEKPLRAISEDAVING